ncbi:hypothetical protein Hanom_Chr13g01233061 [Helianthus anomalus]
MHELLINIGLLVVVPVVLTTVEPVNDVRSQYHHPPSYKATACRRSASIAAACRRLHHHHRLADCCLKSVPI